MLNKLKEREKYDNMIQTIVQNTYLKILYKGSAIIFFLLFTLTCIINPYESYGNIRSVKHLTNKDFIIKNENTYIKLDGKYLDLKTNEKLIFSKEPDLIHAYYFYEYKNFKICSNNEIISSISLITPTLKTTRGIRVGNPISKVFLKYGKTKYHKLLNKTGYYDYFYNKKILTFYVDKEKKVDLISLELI